MQDEIETDVPIVAGGLAGLFVAMGAAEQGARVVVMEKAKIERSGAIAGGVDHCLAYLNEGEWWDTRDGYLDFVKEAAAGAVDIAIHEKIFCDELDEALKRMERIGCPMHDPATGKYQGLGARGASSAWHRRRGRGRQGKRRSLFTLSRPARPAPPVGPRDGPAPDRSSWPPADPSRDAPPSGPAGADARARDTSVPASPGAAAPYPTYQ